MLLVARIALYASVGIGIPTLFVLLWRLSTRLAMSTIEYGFLLVVLGAIGVVVHDHGNDLWLLAIHADTVVVARTPPAPDSSKASTGKVAMTQSLLRPQLPRTQVRLSMQPSAAAHASRLIPVDLDVKANGSDGPLHVRGENIHWTWRANNATACMMDSPVHTGVTTFGDQHMDSADVFYPAIGGRMVWRMYCTDGIDSSTDSVVVIRDAAHHGY